MIISEVIEQLALLQAKHGDLPVYYWDEWHTVLTQRIQFAHAKQFKWDKTGMETRPDRIVFDDNEAYDQ